jgi:hypothetical protein
MNSPWIKRFCWLLLLVVLIVLPARLAHGPSTAAAAAATTAGPPHAAALAVPARPIGWLAMGLAACTLAGFGLTRWRRRI